MKHTLVIALAIALTAASAHARVGETLAEIALRYGAGTKDGVPRLPETERINYLKNGFAIEVMFAGGRSVMEVFHRKDKEITDDDIKELLKVNGEGHSWTLDSKQNLWMRKDRKIRALREPGHRDFFFIQDMVAVKNTGKVEKAKINAF